MGTFYTYEEMHSVGIGPGSPDSWEHYAHIDPVFRQTLETLYTPAAYKALHYDPDTFKRIFRLPGMSFDALEIFKLYDGKTTPLISAEDRGPYRPIFEAARVMVRSNHRNMLQNLVERRTDDVNVFVNMGWATESHMEWTAEPGPRAGPARLIGVGGEDPRLRRMVLRGFFPYLNNLSAALDEIMFFFPGARTDRLMLVTAPSDARRQAIEFIRQNGLVHFFKKVCAQCGKAGNDLFKCQCKAVRYCCAECQRAHWPVHKGLCAWRATQ
jgi:hypothetical protein